MTNKYNIINDLIHILKNGEEFRDQKMEEDGWTEAAVSAK